MKDGMAHKNHPPCHHHHHSHCHKNTGQYLPSILPRTHSNPEQGYGTGRREREQGSNTNKEFIPAFVLVDACQSNNERKIREAVRKLSCLASAQVEPIVNFQDPTGRVSGNSVGL